MLLSEVVEEITEKSPINLSPASIVRKVSQLRKQIIRNYCSDIDESALDLEEGLAQYPLPCSQDRIKEVTVKGCRYDRGSLGDSVPCQYYYILNETIGIYPTPTETVEEGILIFHAKNPTDLTLGDMNDEAGLNEYDMLLVWGVLQDVDPDKQVYKNRYNELFTEYWAANQSVDRSTVKGRW